MYIRVDLLKLAETSRESADTHGGGVKSLFDVYPCSFTFLGVGAVPQLST